ncbi:MULTISPECIES: amidoligase family protein [unclassified Chelatococcus]|uniref:amidoligase family protein n=1 Tax=unclassified Chelatococcus TaxID=2638111 RepID=UPI001BCF2BC4|nr:MULTISPECIES: amidoligase family protein [unclassified Chelatococcus]MBS7700499.1 amidoligase family protein [Chelatococcus sp. YT9]MBX3556295.1 amidoligase family protein [Chelatococcus sp.]
MLPEVATREVGVEFTRISPRSAALALAKAFSGEVMEEDPYAFSVHTETFGRLRVELDVRHVHARRADNPWPWLHPWITRSLGRLLSPFVPRELVTDPLPTAKLPEIDRAVRILHQAGAGGHGFTPFGGLGLHFNVVPRCLDAKSVLSLLQAFLTLEPDLRHAHGYSCPQAAFAPPRFPPAYVRRVLAPEYAPTLRTLCDDYVEANPTRKRALDLLPLLLHLFPCDVAGRIYGKVAPRPALHYRLPLAYVGRGGWSIADAWNLWIEVEKLAQNPDRLGRFATARLADPDLRPIM